MTCMQENKGFVPCDSNSNSLLSVHKHTQWQLICLFFLSAYHVSIRMFGLQHLHDAAQVVLVRLLCAGLVEGDANDTLRNVVQVKFRSLRHHDSVPSWEEICREDVQALWKHLFWHVKMSKSARIHERSALVEITANRQ